MMKLQIEPLLVEVSPDSPCGPDLEYDPDFMALEQDARGKPEQQFGDTVFPPKEPDWIQIRKLAESLLTRTKDLRVVMLLVRATTCLEGMSGLASGLELTEQLLVRYWDHVHPQLDPNDGNDPTMRLNALAPVGDPETLLRDVSNMNVFGSGKFGRLSLRSMLVALGKLAPAADEAVPNMSEIESIVRVAAKDDPASLAALRNALRAADALYVLLGEKVGYDRAPEIKPLTDLLKPVVMFCDSILGDGILASAVAEGGASMDNAGSSGGILPVSVSGDIRSREDAVRMLERVCEFMERTEPANPAPLFIRRAQRLMTKSFIEIVQELVPDSLDQIKRLTGLDPQ